MCRIPHACRRNGRYVFRRRIHFRKIISKPIALALQTADPTLARERTALLSNAIKLAWGRATKRAGVPDLHFHDLRHKAVSRFFELGLSLPEVALISGHRDPRMLMRYTHLNPSTLAEKITGLMRAAT